MSNKEEKRSLFDEQGKQEVAKMIAEFYWNTVLLRLKEAGEPIPDEKILRQLTRELVEKDIKNGIKPLERVFGRVPDAVKLDEKGRRILEVSGNIVKETRRTEGFVSYIHHDIMDKKVQKQRPDIVEWATAEREKLDQRSDM